MAQTLQEALLKAGLVSKEKLDRQKRPRHPHSNQPRPSGPPPSPSILEEKVHEHHLRTECEACKKSGPDVEFYEHSNRMLNVKWLCIKCADTHRISDQCRKTQQSQFARSGRFLREYGATLVPK
jgi:hypothetical protein